MQFKKKLENQYSMAMAEDKSAFHSNYLSIMVIQNAVF